MLPGSDHPDIRDPWIRSSRYSLTPDQIIPRYSCPPGSDHPQIFASPGSDHPDIRYPEIKSSPDIRAPRSDHPHIPGPRSNHPQIFVLPGTGHPDIHNPWSDHPQFFGTHLFVSWWLEPNFHQRLFEKLVSHRLFILLCYGNNWKWLPPFFV